MAQLIRQAIDSGAPPSLARIPMTLEEAAASYEESWGEDEDTEEDSASCHGEDEEDIGLQTLWGPGQETD
jgi:hypothetical protein